MICKVCGTNNRDDEKFCLQCGHEMDEPFPQNDQQNNLKNNLQIDLNNNTQNNSQDNVIIHPAMMPQGGANPLNKTDKISTYLVASSIMLAVTLLFSCCTGFLGFAVLGLAITSLIFAIQANSALKIQSFELAKQQAKKAKIFFFCALGGFWIALIVNIVLAVIMIINAIASSGMPFQDLIKPENTEKFRELLEGYVRQGSKNI